MEAINVLNCRNSEEFRKWLADNHLTETECWVDCKRGKPQKGMFSYIDAVYVALSFGWIDSTYGLVDGKRMQRFSPRREKSHWSELNKERCRWLIKKDMMNPKGFEALPDLDEEFEIDDDILDALKSDDEVWKHFSSYPELYKRIRISKIQNERKNEDNFNKMLANFMKNTKSGKMYGNWDDYGRLR